jgi:ferric-dicitrate binding protein FerR (iron transport regulator)
MTSKSKSNLNLPIYEQAADWLIELREGEVDADTRERLDAWFRASPEHIRAYLELSSIWEEGADPDLDRAHGTDELITRAQGANNVIPLSVGILDPEEKTVEQIPQPYETLAASQANPTEPGSEAPASSSRDDTQDRRHGVYHRFWRPKPMWIAAAVTACLVGSAGLYVYGERNRTIATDTGEQRFVSLVDGSTMELNSRSRVRIRFSDAERDVDLIEGQALFHVAHDAARPFIVHSGATLVRAVGTQFDVYRRDSGTTVTVVEGRVVVLSPMLEKETETSLSGSAAAPEASMRASVSAEPRKQANSQNAIFLGAGEQITVSAQARASPTHTDPAVATAWTQHELVFDSTPLIEVAQDFNRYNTRQLIVNDAALRDFHITGVFSSADPASLLKFLRAQRDLIVQESDDGIHVSKK